MEYDDSDAEIWNPVTSRKKNRTRRCSEMSDSDREKQNESKKARRKEEGEVWKVIVESFCTHFENEYTERSENQKSYPWYKS